MSKVLVTTSPFGQYDKKPIDILQKAKIDFELNDYGRKLTEQELIELISDTEPFHEEMTFNLSVLE